VVRGEGHIARIRRRALTEDISPVLLALVADRGDDDSMPSGERDSQGRYILDGPTNTHAFNFLVECVRRGGQVGAAEMAEWMPDLDSRLEACRNVDYYLLPGPIKSQLTKLLLSSFSLPTAVPGPELPSRLCLRRWRPEKSWMLQSWGSADQR